MVWTSVFLEMLGGRPQESPSIANNLGFILFLKYYTIAIITAI
jgi:hypothetical protein